MLYLGFYCRKANMEGSGETVRRSITFPSRQAKLKIYIIPNNKSNYFGLMYTQICYNSNISFNSHQFLEWMCLLDISKLRIRKKKKPQQIYSSLIDTSNTYITRSNVLVPIDFELSRVYCFRNKKKLIGRT